MNSQQKIAIAGTGYVGLSMALLLAQHHHVQALDIVPAKVEQLAQGISPIADPDIERFLAESKAGIRSLDFSATLDPAQAYSDAQYVVVCTPTNYDSDHNYFDTSSVEAAIAAVREVNQQAWIVIKSTVPVGYTRQLSQRLQDPRIIFSPEFLREGKALYDNLHPSRIVVGANLTDSAVYAAAQEFAQILRDAADPSELERVNSDGTRSIPVLLVGSTEAEAIKLFANTYLALRVAYFNELDTYAAARGLDSEAIIRGVGLDPRIGSHYNNPSFGYGGYCLPKDSKQLLANYEQVPQNLMSAIVDANQTRKEFIAQEILERIQGLDHPLVGIYRLTMKENSDNFRQSAVQDIIAYLLERGVDLVMYEPTLGESSFMGCPVIQDFAEFERSCSLIVANRWNEELASAAGKVYSRDIFRRD
ncbi:UDP-glucose dehydrogenase [Bombiscardovia apis]|uniref:UDP-glucose 6-dehydrogenase n=1 Tax=Bombiscardovia apis TaxID=2932182 RepID=A0ABM8BBJ1_9BIFI|nr:nucleotide sugar dehydrogenase [Bombiscardovia apis]BDR54291.1 UDP-glucose dehydrogenase [Bombiscardovia apis]